MKRLYDELDLKNLNTLNAISASTLKSISDNILNNNSPAIASPVIPYTGPILSGLKYPNRVKYNAQYYKNLKLGIPGGLKRQEAHPNTRKLKFKKKNSPLKLFRLADQLREKSLPTDETILVPDSPERQISSQIIPYLSQGSPNVFSQVSVDRSFNPYASQFEEFQPKAKRFKLSGGKPQYFNSPNREYAATSDPSSSSTLLDQLDSSYDSSSQSSESYGVPRYNNWALYPNAERKLPSRWLNHDSSSSETRITRKRSKSIDKEYWANRPVSINSSSSSSSSSYSPVHSAFSVEHNIPSSTVTDYYEPNSWNGSYPNPPPNSPQPVNKFYANISSGYIPSFNNSKKLTENLIANQIRFRRWSDEELSLMYKIYPQFSHIKNFHKQNPNLEVEYNDMSGYSNEAFEARAQAEADAEANKATAIYRRFPQQISRNRLSVSPQKLIGKSSTLHVPLLTLHNANQSFNANANRIYNTRPSFSNEPSRRFKSFSELSKRK